MTAYPLTFAQESIYFLNDLTNGRPVYAMPQAFRLRGTLNRDALERALRAVVRRHEALRTAIVDSPEGPRQSARDHDGLLRVHNAVSLEDQIADSISEPFQLAEGRPFRVDLYRVSDQEHVLLLNLHHALGDMSSLGVLFRDLSAAYRAEPFTGHVVQMGEFASQKRAARSAPGSREFWRDALADYTGELELPLDRPRPRMPSFAGDAIYSDLPVELTKSTKALGRELRCSVYMICLAALQVLVYRCTGQEKFCVATPFSDRDDPALENTIGYLVNLLPLPCRVQRGQSFTELLETVRRNCLAAYEQNSISFREILKELNLASDSPKPPLARVVFQYFPEMPVLELAGLDCEPMQVHSRTSKFDLCFSLFERAGTITAELEYDSDVFTQATAESWLEHFQTVLRSAVVNPKQTAGALNIISDRERQLLEQWNRTDVAYPRDATVHQLFEQQVAARPDAVAVRSDAETLTYRQLNARANGIAASLKGRGVRPGNFVGVCLPRSTELVAALLGILKAGAAFVPLDANYPKARLEYLFHDSRVRLLITDSRHARIAPAGMDLMFLGKEELTEFIAERVPAVSPAYVMYTSGSTGDPKGVVVPHRAIVRLVKNNDFASFSAKEVWLAFAPVSFDASTLELWAPLLNGGVCAIYPPEFQSVDQFEAVLKKFEVTSLWLTAGFFNTIIDQNPEALTGVRQLLVGGDVLSNAHIRKALEALPNTTLINGYGPTENTTFTCCFRIPSDWPADRPLPIGRPIRNTQVFILDEELRPVPIGVPGDLYAGGDGLALEYLGKPDLTTESFITIEARRLYRTGDRARYLPDGNIDFLGRRDCQVKIRGFRVELGEVEAALRRIGNVRDAAVVAHADSAGSKQLVAYVAAVTDGKIDAEEIKQELGASLPAHSCPSIIIPLAELPLGPNGKVNRAALPKPGSLEPSRNFTAPGSSIEVKIAEIWRQILEVPVIGIDDNFFHLGGESLRATRAISQINRAFNCRLTLPRIFEAPTVRQMARVVSECSENSDREMGVLTGHRSGALPIEVEGLSDEEVDDLLNQLVLSNDPTKPASCTTS